MEHNGNDRNKFDQDPQEKLEELEQDSPKTLEKSEEDSSSPLDKIQNEDKQVETDEPLAYFEQAKEPNSYTKQQNKKKGSFATGFFSGIFGGVLATALIIVLLVNNLLPWTIQLDSNQNSVAGEISEQNNSVPVSDLMNTDALDSQTIDEIAKSVVGIINLRQQNIWSPSEEAGAGSGIIYKKENDKAYIITNNHVVQDAEEVQVQLHEGERVTAKVLGTDALTDLAVLEIDGSNITHVAKLGSSDNLQIGETVLAIGNPLGMDLSGSVTKGIISGLDRSIQVDTTGDNQPDWIADVIQTDAAINPGNSGGALVTKDGELIGINSMKIAQQEVEGIGFAIPIDTALPIVEQLETEGKVSRPFIGITSAPLSQVPPEYRSQIELPEEVENGIVIADVQAGSPAAEAGLQQFDVITKIDGEEINNMLDLRKYLYSEVKVGDTVTLEFYRDGVEQTVDLTLVTNEV